MRREGGDFSSRRGEIGYECIQSFSNSERFSLIVRGFRDRIEYILNTKMSCSRHVLEDVFSKYGKVTDVHIPRDYYTQYIYNWFLNPSEQRGFAFIEFDDRHAAEDAVSHVDGTSIAGFVVSVGPAKNNRKTPEEMRRQYKPYGSDIIYYVVVIQEAAVVVVHTIITIIRIIVVTGPDTNVTLTLATDTLDQVLVLLFLTNKWLNITFSIGKVFECILIC